MDENALKAATARVSPDLLPLLEGFPTFPLNTPSDLIAARQFTSTTAASWGGAPPPDGVERSEVFTPGPDGRPPVRCIVHKRVGSVGGGTLMYVHGGGMVLGQPELCNARMGDLAARFGWTIIAPAYGLAPENPWPQGVEDCLAVLRWMRSPDARAHGLFADRAAVFGESGGGGIAAGVALADRDSGERGITAIGLSAPMLDDRTGREQAPGNSCYGAHIWNSRSNQQAWSMVLATGADTSVVPVPARAIELVGMPPVFIHIGQLDLFFHEALEWTRQLSDAGVDVDLHVFAGAFHGFDLSPEGVAALEARRLMERFLVRHLGANVP